MGASLIGVVVLVNLLAIVIALGTSTVVLEEPSNSRAPSFYRGFVEPIRQRVRVPVLGADQIGVFVKSDGDGQASSRVILRAYDDSSGEILWEDRREVAARAQPRLINFKIPPNRRAVAQIIDLEILPVTAADSFLGIGMSTGDRFAFSQPRILSGSVVGERSHHDLVFRFGRRVSGPALVGAVVRDGGLGLGVLVLVAAVSAGLLVAGTMPVFVAMLVGLLAGTTVIAGAIHFYASLAEPVAFGLEVLRPTWLLNPGTGIAIFGCLALAVAGTLQGRQFRSGSQPELLGMKVGDLAMLGLPVVCLAWAGWQHRWVAEDAFIHFRVVSNLLAGHGPVFNLSERVEASTSPAWVGLLALVRQGTWLDVEWIAVIIGMSASLGGVWLVGTSARTVVCLAHPSSSTRQLVVPIGALVICALPPFWDFATSGLETGLVYVWLGACICGLVRAASKISSKDSGQRLDDVQAPIWLLVLIGLGPLIRPDLAVFSASFLIGVLVTTKPSTWRSVLRILGLMGALPVAYQVFRMGYFGSLVPNTALAKEAGDALWVRGLAYALDLVNPYLLWIPMAAVVWWGLVLVRGRLRRRGYNRLALILAVNAMFSVIYAVWVVRFGGGFMHGRFLLPAVFVLFGPVGAVLPWPSVWTAFKNWPATIPVLVVVPWAVVCAFWLQWSPTTTGVFDERTFNVERSSGYLHPITLSDYEDWPWAQDARRLNELAAAGKGLIALEGTLEQPAAWITPRNPFGDRVISVHQAIGMVGFGAARDVWIVDALGLADPLAARLQRDVIGLPSHEKRLPEAWIVARFAAMDDRTGIPPHEVDAARRVLRCGDIARLLEATTAPLTPELFATNIRNAFGLSRLRIPADPLVAEERLCSGVQ